jgi:tellurite resistance protein
MAYSLPHTSSRQVLQSELQDIAEAREDEMLFIAAVTAGACVARADGWVDPEEREQLVAWMGRAKLLQAFSAIEAEQAFDLRIRQFDDPDGMDTAIAAMRRVAGHPRAGTIVACAQRVAEADGFVQKTEAWVIGVIRRIVSPTGYGLIQQPLSV